MGNRLALQTAPAKLPPPATPSGKDRLDAAIQRALSYLKSIQHQDGYWLGELEADTTLESDYIFYLHVLGRFDSQRVSKLAEYIRLRQLEDGGWNIYFGGPSEVNATLKAYVALKLAGDSPESQHMVRARQRIRQLGGLERTNSFTRCYLALAGLIGWQMVPAIPPELMFLPRWVPLNIYEMSSWTRAIVIPLTILYGLKPCWPVPPHARIDELLPSPDGTRSASPRGAQARQGAASGEGRSLKRGRRDSQQAGAPGEGLNWRTVFLLLDRSLKVYDRSPLNPAANTR